MACDIEKTTLYRYRYVVNLYKYKTHDTKTKYNYYIV